MKKRTLLLLSLICHLVVASPVFSANPESQLAGEFEAYFRKQVSEENIPGAAFVITRPDEFIKVGTFGHTDTSRKTRITADTPFRVASVSKTFAAGLTGVLVKEGEFGWDDRVTVYVPDFRINGDASKVRIRDLLGQSTGLIPHAYDNLIEDGLSFDRIQKQFSKLDYICTPGQCYSYQNSIFSLIEPVMERTTDESYAQLMQSRIFEPLGMENASVGYEPLVNNPAYARPHVKSRGRWKTVKVKPNYYVVAPAAGINASASDMGKWLQAQMGAYPEVLNGDTVETLTEPRVKTRRDMRRRYWRDMLSEAHYGLGWRIYTLGDESIAYHSGWVAGYRADVAWSEKYQVGIAVLMNVEDNTISDVTTTFWKMAFDKLTPAGQSVTAAAGR